MHINTGFAGEFRYDILDSEGNIKTSTDFQKNIILDRGLDSFGGIGSALSSGSCVVGSGNSAPTPGQTTLDSIVDKNSSILSSTQNFAYTESGDVYKSSLTRVFEFRGLGEVNISEVGLTNSYTSSTKEHTLNTRAPIKDVLGNPTTISLLTGEVLQVHYVIWRVIELKETTGTITLTSNTNADTTYNFVCKPALIGSNDYNYGTVGKAFTGNMTYYAQSYDGYTGELGDYLNKPSGSVLFSKNRTTYTKYNLSMHSYVTGSFKRRATLKLELTEGNSSNLRSIIIPTEMGIWQYRYGKADDDSPLVKTPEQEMEFVIEISWGRYEGEL